MTNAEDNAEENADVASTMEATAETTEATQAEKAHTAEAEKKSEAIGIEATRTEKGPVAIPSSEAISFCTRTLSHKCSVCMRM